MQIKVDCDVIDLTGEESVQVTTVSPMASTQSEEQITSVRNVYFSVSFDLYGKL